MLIDRTGWRRGDTEDALVTREWLVPNGLGGYASGTLGGVTSRRFHGLLIAALPPPHGRTMMVNRFEEELTVEGQAHRLVGSELEGFPRALPSALDAVFFEGGLPVWRYVVGDVVLEKRIVMPRQRNTTYVAWRLISAACPLTLRVRPEIHVRPHEGNLAADSGARYAVQLESPDHWRISSGSGLPPIHLRLLGGAPRSTLEESVTPELLYRVEKDRGYDYRGSLFSPGQVELVLAPGEEATAILTLESADATNPMITAEVRVHEVARRNALIDAAVPDARQGLGEELVLAADAFVIRPVLHEEDSAASSEDRKECTVIAGYHWFTDWGRDTMISLEGLTLLTGRHADAAHILRRFAKHAKNGLIPNMFPEGKSAGLYHTADATLWFFHALDRYLSMTGDRETLRLLLPIMEGIVDHHVRGTSFGIGVDPRDGLLKQGAEGYQLTWMDAKVGDWVVTPRRGKAVEINALWFNALTVLSRWLREEQRAEAADSIAARAEGVRVAFNARFWFERGQHLYDVIDGPEGTDASLRPNQIFAVSLPNPVLDSARWKSVVGVVREKLLTPVGLRSLSPDEPRFQKRYDGDLHARDAAYHEGTVWGWLAGPFVDAWLRVHPEDAAGARHLVEGFASHLGEACVGSIGEIFDAEPPFTPRGCVAQAWSVAEALRAWVRTAGTSERDRDR